MLKVLIDEGVPHPMRTWIVDAEVDSVQWMGWTGIKNGELIRRINESAFNVVICNDKQWRHQQNRANWVFGVIELSTNLWPTIKLAAERSDLIARLNFAVRSVKTGEIIEFKIGGDKT